MTTTAKINLRAMRTDTRNDFLQRYVREAAEFLPEWEYETPEYGHVVRLLFVDPINGTRLGPSIYARADGNRIVFTGRLPEGTHNRLYSPPGTISTSADPNREPRLVASQITHRLIPEYLSNWSKAEAALAELDTAEGKTKAVVEELRSDEVVTDGDRFTAWGPTTSDGYADVKVWHGGDKVNLTVRGVTVEQAHAILSIVRKGA